MEDNIYEIVFDPDKMDGVNAISLVSDPAIEVDFYAFSKEDRKIEHFSIAKSDEAQRLIMTPAMIPNLNIYRKNVNGEEGYVFYSEDTVKKMAFNYLKKFNHNSSLEHKIKIDEGIYVVESWLVEDPTKDKSQSFGFDVPKGTWMITMSIEDPIIWDKYIASGELKGASVEMQASIVKKQKTMNEKIKELFQKAIQLIDMESEEMALTIGEYVMDTFEIGKQVKTKDGAIASDVTIEYEDKIAVTNADGYIETIDPKVKEEVEVKVEQEEEEKEKTEVEVKVEDKDEPKEEVKVKEEEEVKIEQELDDTPAEKVAEIVEKEAEIEVLKLEIEQLKAELDKLKGVEAELQVFLAQTPATKGVINAPSNKDFKDQNYLELIRSLNK